MVSDEMTHDGYRIWSGSAQVMNLGNEMSLGYIWSAHWTHRNVRLGV